MPPPPRPSHPRLPRSRTGRPWDVFLAHAGPDAAVAEELFETLAGRGVRVFLDKRGVGLGLDWDQEIPRALRRSAVIAALVSERSGDAFYQREEVRAAIQRARQDPWIRLVPIPLGGVKGWEDQIYGLGLKQALIPTGEVKNSYGMYDSARDILNDGSKALVMDYDWIIAKTTHDWAQDESSPGVPTFARHMGKLNVLFVGEEVRLMRPEDVNPADAFNQSALWNP